MNIVLYNCIDENNKLFKRLNNLVSIDAKLKDDYSPHTLSFIVNKSALNEVINEINYCYIPDMERYYFVTKEFLTGGVIRCLLNCDVLMSHQAEILSLQGILEKTETDIYNVYLTNEDVYLVETKETITTKVFPSGFNESGEFILITAGAV